MERGDPNASGWTRLSTVPSKPEDDFVYRIWCDDPIPRAIGSSNVLYIGQGKSDRLRLLLEEKHPAQARLREFETIRCSTRENKLLVTYQYKPVDSTNNESLSFSRIVEIVELNDFVRKHGELPLLNRKHEGWAAGKVLAALTKRLTGRDQAPILDSPEAGWSMTWGTAPAGEFVLAWLWPETWRNDKVDPPYNRGDLLLIRPGKEGELLPAVLNPEHPLWNPNSRVTARCRAGVLAGRSAHAHGDDSAKHSGATSMEELTALWRALSAGTSRLDILEHEMNNREETMTAKRGG